MGPQCNPPPQAVLTTSKALRANWKRRLLRCTLAPPLYKFPFGLKEIDFGKQTTNYNLHGSCFIIQTKRAILHGKLLNEGILTEFMQKDNIPVRCFKLPGCLLQGLTALLRPRTSRVIHIRLQTPILINCPL